MSGEPATRTLRKFACLAFWPRLSNCLAVRLASGCARACATSNGAAVGGGASFGQPALSMASILDDLLSRLTHGRDG